MGQHIKLTEARIREILSDVEKELRSSKMFDGTISMDYTLPPIKDAKASILFEPMAYAKMMSLVMHFGEEVAWHGVAERCDGGNGFLIKDILVYPQVVSGVTVNTDQAQYEAWLMGLDDEVFNKLRMQGHSHVNMSVSPSGVDNNHQAQILEQPNEEDFYIFLIVNKRLEMFVSIFDMANNTLFETADVSIYIGSAEFDGEAFIKEAKGLVDTKSYKGSYGSAYAGKKSYWGKDTSKRNDVCSYGSGVYGGGYDDDLVDDDGFDYYDNMATYLSDYRKK